MARDDATLRRFLHGLPGVDQVGADARAAGLATRSIKTTAKAWAIDASISMVDLTTLEGSDTPGKLRALCGKARHPDPTDPSTPPVAAICIYPLRAQLVALFSDLPAVAGSLAERAQRISSVLDGAHRHAAPRPRGAPIGKIVATRILPTRSQP